MIHLSIHSHIKSFNPSLIHLSMHSFIFYCLHRAPSKLISTKMNSTSTENKKTPQLLPKSSTKSSSSHKTSTSSSSSSSSTRPKSTTAKQRQLLSSLSAPFPPCNHANPPNDDNNYNNNVSTPTSTHSPKPRPPLLRGQSMTSFRRNAWADVFDEKLTQMKSLNLLKKLKKVNDEEGQ